MEKAQMYQTLINYKSLNADEISAFLKNMDKSNVIRLFVDLAEDLNEYSKLVKNLGDMLELVSEEEQEEFVVACNTEESADENAYLANEFDSLSVFDKVTRKLIESEEKAFFEQINIQYEYDYHKVREEELRIKKDIVWLASGKRGFSELKQIK